MDNLKQAHRTMLTIYLGIVGGCAMFLAVLYFILKNPTTAQTAVKDVSQLRLVVLVVGVGALISSILVKQALLKTAPGVNKDIKALINRLLTTTFICLALCEGAVLLNAIIAFLSHEASNLILPVLLAVIGFSMHFPRYQEWEQWIQSQGVIG